MTYASATAVNRRNYQRNRNSVSYTKNRTGLGPISNFIVLAVLACLLAVVYLSQVTRTNGYSYSLDDLKEEKVQLEQEFASLEVETARLRSVEAATNSQVASDLVDPESVQYVN